MVLPLHVIRLWLILTLFLAGVHAYAQSLEQDTVNNVTIFIPGAFTPNGDGVNDQFIGKGENIREMLMWIFDRQGNLIYQTPTAGSSNLIPWNGRLNNNRQDAPEGVYLYVIRTTDELGIQKKHMGSFVLIR